MRSELIQPLDERYQTYLHDESRLSGEAQSISFPESEAEIAAIVAEMRAASTPVTVQGGRTGLTGGAVPLGGHVMNLARMNRIGHPQRMDDGTWVVTVEPGATLLELRRALAGARADRALFWPPDPTESTATVGGVVSCNARGLTAALYGSTREQIAALRVVTADNAPRDVAHGSEACCPGCGLDLFDLVAGGEGMFGVIGGLTLKLRPKPRVVWGICFFFPDRESLCAVADRLAGAGSPPVVRAARPAPAFPPALPPPAARSLQPARRSPPWSTWTAGPSRSSSGARPR